MTQDLISLIAAAARAAHDYCDAARIGVGRHLAPEGRLDSAAADRGQRMLHGLAWIATTSEALTQSAQWAAEARAAGMFGPMDDLALRIGFGEYLHQLASGIPISQNEIVRPGELGLDAEAAALCAVPEVAVLLKSGNTAETRLKLSRRLADGDAMGRGIIDETLRMVSAEFGRFTETRIVPGAQGWHLVDELLPEEILEEMAALGTFGVCIAPEFGGLGLGKVAMCVITEELSRGWIAAGSIGTRSEIAGELISLAGTEAQKARWLPAIASGECLPAAVFTEPDTGSDLARLRTRAVRDENGGWKIHGNKTWITHAARSDLMTVLARTDPNEPGHAGLSMLLLEKTRGSDAVPFPDPWLEGTEIPVLGYRGMKEYELAFKDAPVSGEGLLGGAEGAGFKQLMQTFEGARIQTAARALGVGWRALELGLRYACERRQFGSPLIGFPRVSDKLALMVAEIAMTRTLTYYAARRKDGGQRCDIEAGMAKLLAARVAWANADAALQIHGGNGYALEYEISRVLCDARILNIFEGAAEIQAHVIGRGLLTRRGNRGD
jgi:(2S)-methylsuccinyl-CoA dehydrogenase